MRHRVAGRKLGRTSSHRKAMFRNMVTSLLEHERIRTTDAKAKELRRVADRMITLGKTGTLHARRQAAAVLRSRQAARKLFNELAGRYENVSGGYTRIVKVGPRVGDGAMISLVELVTPRKPGARSRKKGTKRTASRKTASGASQRKRQEAPKKAPKSRAKKAQDEKAGETEAGKDT